MKRLIVPPLPAPSRPSNRTTIFLSRVLDPVLNLQQFDLQFRFMLFVVFGADVGFVGVFAGFEEMLDGGAVVAQNR